MIARPFLLRRLSELHVIDGVREQACVRDGIVTVADLELAIAERRAAADDPALRRAAAPVAEQRSMTLGRAWDVLDPFLEVVAAASPDAQALEAAGGARRGEPIVHTLAVVGRTGNPGRTLDDILRTPSITDVLHRTGRRALVVFDGHEVDLRLATAEEWGTVLFVATGPAPHVVEVQKRRGPMLSASEAEVYTRAGLAYLPPEVRGHPSAIEAAAAKQVPRLVERADIRGDLHMHTTYSDGRDTLRRMVQASQALGYEYVAITDHSEHAGAGRTVDAARLARQHDEILRMRAEYPGMTIFHGLEVDILPDGSLDCPDTALASLDIVLASLHDSAGHDGATLTRRCLAAIHHPLVSVITHPANQLVGRRAGYDMDYDAIYAGAAETGTALEVDGAPAHLDLSGERAAEAVRGGVTLVIDSDCHRASALDRQMRMGVATARRGWVQPAHVLNTGSAADVRAFVARKRGR